MSVADADQLFQQISPGGEAVDPEFGYLPVCALKILVMLTSVIKVLGPQI